MHVAGRLFDAVVLRAGLDNQVAERLRAALRLATLCHDLGHMPFSHASEKIAPLRASLQLPNWARTLGNENDQATHEDFTVRLLLDSSLTPLITDAYAHLGVTASMAASLITGLHSPEHERFVVDGVDWFPVLRALVSGELDADRMDYLLRDSFYTGVNYGRFDFEWISQNLSSHVLGDRRVLALSKAAVFAFEDFLLSRYHMFLSVYYHHTSVSFDYMLQRFYQEAPGDFSIPSDPASFLFCDDVALHTALRNSENQWARRITRRKGYKRVAQFTQRDAEYNVQDIASALLTAGVEHFTLESKNVLSKYFGTTQETALYVLDMASQRLTPIAEYTPLYQQFSGAVTLSRIYVLPEQVSAAEPILKRLTGGGVLPHE